SLLVTGTDLRLLIAGLTTGELFQSSDAGATWLSLSLIRPITPVERIVQHPDDPTKLYAATASGLKMSPDNGLTWTTVDLQATPDPAHVQVLAIDPYNASLMYAGLRASGLVRSTDGGYTWQKVTGLKTATADTAIDVRDIAIDPARPNTMYLAVMGNGILKSSDAGVSWAQITKELGNPALRANTICISGIGKTILFGTASGNIFASSDGGSRWEPSRQGYLDGRITSLATIPGKDTFYAGTELGVQISTNGGKSWTPLSADLPVYPSTIVTAQRGTTGLLYVFGEGIGLQHSTDGGVTWMNRGSNLGGSRISAIVSDRTGQTVYCVSGGSVHRFDPAGSAWVPASNKLSGAPITALALPPDSSRHIVAGGADGIYYSTNEGSSWSSVTRTLAALPVRFLATHPIIQTRFIVSGDRGVFLSTSSGKTWVQTTPPTAPFTIRSLTFFPKDAGLHFAATANAGVQITSNGGRSWDPARYGLDESDILAVTLGTDDQTCFAWSTNGRSYRSTNRGLEWKQYTTPWKPGSRIQIAVDKHSPSQVVALLDGNDLYYSSTGGTGWRLVPAGRLPEDVLAFCWNAASATLYAGTDIDGVYRLKLGTIMPRLLEDQPSP
ncbi:MAG: YCF48-related protein, partial [Ignavibacteria bacterium]|nr:YCF48-related protein [Ignavibacteria bacterium]